MTTRIADVRELPFAEGSFDVAFCVSTLEHVGRDNSVYGVSEERDEQGMTSALGELRRVLAPGGRLLVTVPCGEHEDHGWFVQHEVAAWLQLFDQAGLAVDDQEIYERTEAGWQAAESFEESGVRYGLHGPGASAVLCSRALAALTSLRAPALGSSALRRRSRRGCGDARPRPGYPRAARRLALRDRDDLRREPLHLGERAPARHGGGGRRHGASLSGRRPRRRALRGAPPSRALRRGVLPRGARMARQQRLVAGAAALPRAARG